MRTFCPECRKEVEYQIEDSVEKKIRGFKLGFNNQKGFL